MQQKAIHRVLIIGAGTMGQQIGWQCAAHGCDVVLYDVAAPALDSALDHLGEYAADLRNQGLVTVERCEATFKRVITTTDPKYAAQEIDLISESVPEDPKLKGKVFARFETLCPPRTIFTTDTSTLIPSQFAKASGWPERLLTLHFHPPVWTHNIVDVMPL